MNNKAFVIRKKSFVLFMMMFLCAFVIASAGKVNAAQSGWKTENGKKVYVLANNKKASGFKKVGKNYYYFKKGVWQSGWKKVNGKKYYFSPKNGKAVNGVKKIGKKVYIFTNKRLAGTGLYKIGKKTYYAKKGVLKTGLVTYKKNKYYSTKKGLITGLKKIKNKKGKNKYYYFDKKTFAMVTNKTVGGRYFGPKGYQTKAPKTETKKQGATPSKNEETTPANTETQKKLDKKSVSMKIGQKTKSGTKGIVLTVQNAENVSSWFTEDPTVADIKPFSTNKCHVYAIGYGTTNITVKADGKTLKCKVSVKDPHPNLKVSMPYSGYKKLTKKAKGRVSNVIAIARTQKGYRGVSTNGFPEGSYFGSKWNTYSLNTHDCACPGAWCSDFVTWCLVAARVPGAKGLYDVVNGYSKSRTIAGYYGNKCNSLYRYRPSYSKYPNTVNSLLKGYKVKGTLNAKTIRKGDIAIIDRSHSSSPSALHTAIVVKVNRSGDIQVVEGNSGNSVPSQERWISASNVFMVARPSYNK